MSSKSKTARVAAVIAALLALTGCMSQPEPSPSPTANGVTSSPELSPNASPESSGTPQTTTVPGNSDTAVQFTPGTYTAKAQGMNGDVGVSVTFSDSAITEVQVTEHTETQGIYERPVDEIPRAIVEGQTLDVDVIAGATWTSNAIIQAVEDCVTQAGGDPAALKRGDSVPDDGILDEVEDVLPGEMVPGVTDGPDAVDMPGTTDDPNAANMPGTTNAPATTAAP